MLQLLYLLGKRVAGANSMRVYGPESMSGSFAGKKISCPCHKLNHNLLYSLYP
jgi:hypothetical protein